VRAFAQVADFGHAWRLHAEHDWLLEVESGTCTYMAPEVMAGAMFITRGHLERGRGAH
jgi:hypothetical protein